MSSEYDSSDHSPPQSPQPLPALQNNTSIKPSFSNNGDSNLGRLRYIPGELRQESLQQRHGQQHSSTEQTRSQENCQETALRRPRDMSPDHLWRMRMRRDMAMAAYAERFPEEHNAAMAEMQDFMDRVSINTPPEDIIQEKDTSMEEDGQADPVPNDSKRKGDELGDEQPPCHTTSKRPRRSFPCLSKKEDGGKDSGASLDLKRKRDVNDGRQLRSKRVKARSASLNQVQDPKRKRDNEQDEEVFSPKRARSGRRGVRDTPRSN